MDDDEYEVIDQTLDVIELLRSLGDYSFLLEALEKTKLLKPLKTVSDPNYAGPVLPEAPKKDKPPQFPWWFGFEVNRTSLPPVEPVDTKPQPAPKEGLPLQGPYTVCSLTRVFRNALSVCAGLCSE